MKNFERLKSKLTDIFKKHSLSHRLIQNPHSLELNSEKSNEINLIISSEADFYDLYFDGYLFSKITEDEILELINRALNNKLRIRETKASYFAYLWELEEEEGKEWMKKGQRKLKLYPFWKAKKTTVKYLS